MMDKNQAEIDTAEHQAGATQVLQTSQHIKSALQELLKYGLLEMDRKSHLYQTALVEQNKLNELLEPLDLALRVDDIRGLAFLTVRASSLEVDGGEGEWAHPLVRRQRLTLEQSLLLALLRQHYVLYEQNVGVGAGNAVLTLDDLLPQLHVYLGDTGSDMKNRKRLLSLLDNLKTHGIVSEVDDREQFTIRPIITHLATPETLQILLAQFRLIAAEKGKDE